MKKRIISFVCAMTMIFGVIAEPAMALETQDIQETESQSETETLPETVLETESLIQETVPETALESKNEELELMTVEEEEKGLEIEAEALGKGNFKIKITGVEEIQNVKNIRVPVWQKSDQSDMYWYTAEKQNDGSYVVNGNIEKHKYHTGEYIIHVYVEKQDGKMEYIKDANVVIGGMSVGAFYDVPNEYSRKLILENVEDQGIASKVQIAVWSAEKGQDDLFWYTANKNGSSYSADVMFYNHKNLGDYYAHAYISGKDGSMTHVSSLTFEVTEFPKEKMEIVKVDSTKGQISVKYYLNRNKEDINAVYLAAWSKSNQSDQHWYTAEKQSDGSYLTVLDVKNHKYNLGNYIMHGYVKEKNGKMTMIDDLTYKLKMSEGTFKEELNENGYSIKLTVSGAELQGIDSAVRIAVWSAEKGQDDIKWYTATKNGSQYTVDVMFYNHKDCGSYYAHVYVADKNGKMHLLQAEVFEVANIPEEKVGLINTNPSEGSFNVSIYVNRPEDVIDVVYLAAWSKSNQSDQHWYKAERQTDGSYLVKGNISNHNYNTGNYILHGYLHTKQGQMIFIDSIDCEIKFSIGELISEETSSKYTKKLVLKEVKDQGLAKKIYFAVWSAEKGQDDIYWYEPAPQKGNYVTEVVFQNHKSNGTYYAHAYMQNRNGQMQLLKELTFELECGEVPKDTLEISNLNESNGSFDSTLYLLGNKPNIKNVYFAVWSRNNQSDQHWYKAAKQGNGTYKVSIDAKKHQWNSGTYYVHAYIETTQGKMQFVTSAEQYMKLERKIFVEKVNNCSVSIKVFGLDDVATGVRFLAWSDVNGQDDSKWYDAEINTDGSWGAVVHSKNHKDVGTYISEIYYVKANGTDYVETVSFDIKEKWDSTWQWIDGYKRYINTDGEIETDVSRLVTGPYLIKVYKWSNYLIIFAKDENGEYKVPVKAMITSCGNATPTGTYYSPHKWRWLTMVGGSKAQWCTQIIGDFLFHSVPYRREDPTTLYTDIMYNHLGTTQSLGCIRLQAGDAKWIYDNCSLGTQIIITPNESGGPIAKPAFNPVPAWHTWDPTDPNVRYLCQKHGCH